MRKSIIRFLVVTTVLSLICNNVFAVNKESEACSNNKVIIEDVSRNYYSTIETIYTNEVSTKFFVTEYDKSFYLEFLNSGNVLIDNVEYQEEDFQKMILSQDCDLNKNRQISTLSASKVVQCSILEYKDNYIGKLNTVDYNEINRGLKSKEMVNHAKCINTKLRCTACGKYSPNSAPTSGYHSFTTGYVKRGKFSSLIIAMTSGAIGDLAEKLCKGKVEKAKKLMNILVGWLADDFIDKTTNGDYSLRQTWHDVCPRATREQRKYYVINKSGLECETGIVDDYYYYSSNPY